MVAFGHTALGVIVGVTTYQYLGESNLVSGLAIAAASGILAHYSADFIPHGHFFKPEKFKKYLIPIIIFDLFLSVVLFLGWTFLKDGFGEKFLYIMFGIGGSQLPDILDGLVYIGVIKAKGLFKIENNFHQKLHWHGTGSKALLLGLYDIWQVFIILTAFFLI